MLCKLCRYRREAQILGVGENVSDAIYNMWTLGIRNAEAFTHPSLVYPVMDRRMICFFFWGVDVKSVL